MRGGGRRREGAGTTLLTVALGLWTQQRPPPSQLQIRTLPACRPPPLPHLPPPPLQAPLRPDRCNSCCTRHSRSFSMHWTLEPRASWPLRPPRRRALLPKALLCPLPPSNHCTLNWPPQTGASKLHSRLCSDSRRNEATANASSPWFVRPPGTTKRTIAAQSQHCTGEQTYKRARKCEKSK